MLVDHEDLLTHWTDRGLLEPDHAARLATDLPPATSRFGAAVTAGLEALAYLGAALAIGAVALLFDVADWSRGALLALLLAVAGVGAATVWRITPSASGPMSRLATVAGTAGGAALVGFAALLFDPALSGNVEELVIAATGTAAAVALYVRERNAVTHAWIGIGTAATTWTFAVLVVGDTTRSAELVASGILLAAALAWTWASETGRLVPAWVGTFGASAVALASVVNLADWDPFGASGDLPIVAALLFGLAWTIEGTLLDRWRLTTVGALVLVFTVPWTLTEVLGLSSTATALLLLPAGLVLLAWAARQLRDTTVTA